MCASLKISWHTHCEDDRWKQSTIQGELNNMNNNIGIKAAADNLNLQDAGAAISKTAGEMGDSLNESAETAKEQFSEKVGAFKEKVSDNLLGIAEKVHEKSDTAQDYLLEKSDKVNSYAHQTIEAAGHLGHRAADALDASSGYVKNFDLAETRQNVVESIRQRPEVSIAVAGVFGLLIGLLIGRSSK